MNYVQSKQMGYLHPDLVLRVEQLQEECKKRGIPIKFAEGYRTVEEQNALYAQGRSKPGVIVTNATGASYNSQHQWGIAVDFYRADGKGAYNEEDNYFARVGNIALGMGLGWGGTWKRLVDKPHLYLNQWGSTTSALKNKYGDPKNFIGTWRKVVYVDTDSVSKDKLPQAYAESTKAEVNNIYGTVKEGEKLKNKEWQYVFIAMIQSLTQGANKVDGIAGTVTVASTLTISKFINNKHKCVYWVQQWLNRHGYDCGMVDGIAGTKFDEAIKKLQKDIGLSKPDGELTAGKATWKYILTHA